LKKWKKLNNKIKILKMSVKKGDSVKVHYIGTLNDGNEFDNSYKRGSTLDFKVGEGNMIKGFDSALLGMEVGEKKTVNLEPKDAYGERIEEAIQTVSKDQFGDVKHITEGSRVNGQTQDGRPISALVMKINEDDVVLDLNHPFAGKELNFEIELVEVD
jgi:peptidylprolyl isomerase